MADGVDEGDGEEDLLAGAAAAGVGVGGLCKARLRKRARLCEALVAGGDVEEGTASAFADRIEEAILALDKVGGSWKSAEYKRATHELILRLREEEMSALRRKLIKGEMEVAALVKLRGKRLTEAAAAAEGKALEAGEGLAFPAQNAECLQIRDLFTQGGGEGFSLGAVLQRKEEPTTEARRRERKAKRKAEREAMEQKGEAVAQEEKEEEAALGTTGKALQSPLKEEEGAEDNVEQADEEEKEEEEEKAAAPDTAEKVDKDSHQNSSCKIYCGGCPFWATEADIQEFFEPYTGNITSIECLTFPDTGRFRGIAFITFETQEGADAAVSYDGEIWESCQLKIKHYQGTGVEKSKHKQKAYDGDAKKVAGSVTAYVGNLDWNVNEAALRNFFKEYNVAFIRMALDAEEKFRGFAHVQFKTEEELDRAMALSGSELCGRPCKMQYSDTRSRTIKQQNASRGKPQHKRRRKRGT